MKPLIAALPVLLAVLFDPAPAQACTCAAGALQVSPANGSRGIPLNVVPRMLFVGGFSDVRLVRQDGVEVDLQQEEVQDASVRFVTLRPQGELLAGTLYELWVDDQVISSFETGTARDTTPPTGDGLLTFDRERSYYESAPTCGTWQTDGYTLELAPGADDLSAPEDVWYHLYVGRSGDAPDLTRPVLALPAGVHFVGESLCSDSLRMVGGDLSLVVAPVDLAGNEGPRVNGQLASCGCAAGGGGGAQLALWAAAMAAALGRRRR